MQASTITSNTARVADTDSADAGAKTAQTGNTSQAGSIREQVHASLNIAIVNASMSVAISSQNEPLALLYKSAITSLNETLQPELGENAIQNAAGQDNTPDGTSGRIVSLSTGFFQRYKDQHPGEDETAVLKNFMQTIRGGVDRGFSEARDILQGLKVLNGDIGANVDKTYALVQQGYDAFQAAEQAKIDAKAQPATPAAAATST